MLGRVRFAVIAAPRELRIAQDHLESPAAGALRVALEGCGVCSSNLPAWQGREWFRYPLPPGSPGHEGWGRVDAVGAGVTELSVGDRVAFLSGAAYASHVLVPARECVRLPRELDDMPFPGEPIACAVNVFRRARVSAGQDVAVIGIGFIGALVTRLCANAGARVIAVARRPFAQDLARRFGAHEAIPIDDRAAAAGRVRELTGGRFCDRVIECVGEQGPLDLATDLTRERGRLVIAGYHQDGLRTVNLQVWNWRGMDVVNAHERDPQIYLEGMRMGVDLVTSGKLDPRPLLTHSFPLDRLGDAFDAAVTRPGDFVKAWVHP